MILSQLLSEVNLISDSSFFQALLVNEEELLKSFPVVFHIHSTLTPGGLYAGWSISPYRNLLAHFIADTMCNSAVTQHQILWQSFASFSIWILTLQCLPQFSVQYLWPVTQLDHV